MMAARPGTARIQELEARIAQLESLHGQVVAYAEDLNRTYQELRSRLQQMTALSEVASRLARARTVEACARVCVEQVGLLFPGASGRVYLEDRRGALRVAAAHGNEVSDGWSALFDHGATSSTLSNERIHRTHSTAAGGLALCSMPFLARGKRFGALVVGRPSENEFNEHDVHAAELLASTTAVAVANTRLYQETRRLAITDPTTGVFNFRHFRLTLAEEVQKARRLQYPLALIMADLDYFKRFNDLYGHPKGNLALQAVARAIRNCLRQTDTVARYGGEEFAVILPGCDRLALLDVAEKIRRAVARAPVRIAPGLRPVRVTISAGGAWQGPSEADAGRLLAAADKALYRAKELGRDRSHVED